MYILICSRRCRPRPVGTVGYCVVFPPIPNMHYLCHTNTITRSYIEFSRTLCTRHHLYPFSCTSPFASDSSSDCFLLVCMCVRVCMFEPSATHFRLTKRPSARHQSGAATALRIMLENLLYNWVIKRNIIPHWYFMFTMLPRCDAVSQWGILFPVGWLSCSLWRFYSRRGERVRDRHREKVCQTNMQSENEAFLLVCFPCKKAFPPLLIRISQAGKMSHISDFRR